MKVVGIRFRKAGKIYYFAPGEIEVTVGDNVVVETARGVEYGSVVIGEKSISEEDISEPLKKIIRVSAKEDDIAEEKNKKRKKEAFDICLEKIRSNELDMKLIDCEYTFDNRKLLFYFTADGRVDFRNLVKDLASVFRTRIELRQVGVRDETKMMGSIGICGRTLCCHSHLSEFHPVSIKMAKQQNLSLNPSKISGVCGRLMCCLKYEEETYKMLNKNLPRVGDVIEIKESGELGEVIKVNIIRQRIKAVVRKAGSDSEVLTLKIEEIKLNKRTSKQCPKISNNNKKIRKKEK